jgi:hypothetical protein
MQKKKKKKKLIEVGLSLHGVSNLIEVVKKKNLTTDPTLIKYSRVVK